MSRSVRKHRKLAARFYRVSTQRLFIIPRVASTAAPTVAELEAGVCFVSTVRVSRA